MNTNDLESLQVAPPLGEVVLSERNRLVTDEGMIELAKRVESFRKQAGILQSELAEKLGVTQPMISRIEAGLVRLNGELIVTLAKIFSITTDELLGVKSKGESEASVPRRWIKRLGRIDELPKRDQDALARIIDAFLERQTKKAS